MSQKIGSLALSISWGGESAEKGLARLSEGMGRTAKAAKTAANAIGGVPGKPITVNVTVKIPPVKPPKPPKLDPPDTKPWIRSLTDVKSAISLVQGLLRTLVIHPVRGAYQFLELAGHLDTLRVHFALLAGSYPAGVAALESVRDAATASGIPLDALSDSILSLTRAGLSLAGASEQVQRIAAAAELLGGEKGAQQITTALTGLLGEAVATEQGLAGLRASGLNAFGALAGSLTDVTGRVYTVGEATAALKRGAILAGTAFGAIDAAANSPAIKQAAERFANSFDGQIARLRVSVTETGRDLAKTLLDGIDFNRILAGVRGAVIGVRDIVQEIAATLGQPIDPQVKTDALRDAFAGAREAIVGAAEVLARAAVDVAETITIAADSAATVIARVQQARDAATLPVRAILNPVKGIDDAVNLALTPPPPSPDRDKQFAGARKNLDDFFARARMRAHADPVKVPVIPPDPVKVPVIPPDPVRVPVAPPTAPDPVIIHAQAAPIPLVDVPVIGPPPVHVQVASVPLIDVPILRPPPVQIDVKTEALAQSVRKWAAEATEATRTPFDALIRQLDDLRIVSDQAAGAMKALTAEERGKFAEQMRRKQGELLLGVIRNQQTDSWKAGSAQVGSQEDVEIRLRHRFGVDAQPVQDRLEAALREANEISKQQLKAQEELVRAFDRIPKPPPVMVVPRG